MNEIYDIKKLSSYCPTNYLWGMDWRLHGMHGKTTCDVRFHTINQLSYIFVCPAAFAILKWKFSIAKKTN